MERIFGEHSVYTQETRSTLKNVMLVDEQNETDLLIYGKTGMGVEKGTVVDAWFTGFAENGDKKLYYCVYPGRTDDKDVSSSAAKEIAVRMVTGYCNDKWQ